MNINTIKIIEKMIIEGLNDSDVYDKMVYKIYL